MMHGQKNIKINMSEYTFVATVNNYFDFTDFKEMNFTFGKRPKNLPPENK